LEVLESFCLSTCVPSCCTDHWLPLMTVQPAGTEPMASVSKSSEKIPVAALTRGMVVSAYMLNISNTAATTESAAFRR
jgi:hypothetical protein